MEDKIELEEPSARGLMSNRDSLADADPARGSIKVTDDIKLEIEDSGVLKLGEKED